MKKTEYYLKILATPWEVYQQEAHAEGYLGTEEDLEMLYRHQQTEARKALASGAATESMGMTEYLKAVKVDLRNCYMWGTRLLDYLWENMNHRFKELAETGELQSEVDKVNKEAKAYYDTLGRKWKEEHPGWNKTGGDMNQVEKNLNQMKAYIDEQIWANVIYNFH